MAADKLQQAAEELFGEKKKKKHQKKRSPTVHTRESDKFMQRGATLFVLRPSQIELSSLTILGGKFAETKMETKHFLRGEWLDERPV